MGTLGIARASAGVIAALALALTITSCSAAQGKSEPKSTTTAPSDTATPDAAPEEPAAPPEVTATCDAVLTDTEYASLEAGGLSLTEPFMLDSTFESMIAEGGLGCMWGPPEGDVRVWFAQLNIDAAGWDAKLADLTAAGYTETGDPLPGTIQAPTDNDNDYIPAIFYKDGVMYYASFAPILGSVLALQE